MLDAAPQDSVAEHKRTLRAALRERRPLLDAGALHSASEAAQSRLLREELIFGANTVALYAALPREVQTEALGRMLAAAGKRICFPAVRGDERVLEFREIEDDTGKGLLLGALGIHEPSGTQVPLACIDFFVLPALAVDLHGRRLGRGRGHYDATLAAAAPRALRVALVFDWQVVDEVPVREHDQCVDAVCTELRFIRCERGGAPA